MIVAQKHTSIYLEKRNGRAIVTSRVYDYQLARSALSKNSISLAVFDKARDRASNSLSQQHSHETHRL